MKLSCPFLNYQHYLAWILLVQFRETGLGPPEVGGGPLLGGGQRPHHGHHGGGPGHHGVGPTWHLVWRFRALLLGMFSWYLLRIPNDMLHHLTLHVAPDVTPVVHEEFVVLEGHVSRGVLLLHLPHELPQFRPTLPHSSRNYQENKEKSTKMADFRNCGGI